MKGVDFIQVGMTAVAINARGFNSSFNNRMLHARGRTHRRAPESGLPLGSFTTMPKVDLAGDRGARRPGSALYGPDASNGVVTLTTKDPREYRGTTLEVTGGSAQLLRPPRSPRRRHAETSATSSPANTRARRIVEPQRLRARHRRHERAVACGAQGARLQHERRAWRRRARVLLPATRATRGQRLA